MAFLEDYTYLEQLGQGGYATVYKVRHNKFRYIRALRVLNATIAQGENDPIYQKFLEECALLLRLGNGCHPNIVHIYQPLLKAQKAIVEMDYVDGQDLYHYLSEQKGFIPVDDVICLVTQIGSALAYCHHDIYEFCMDREEDNLQDDPNDGSKVLMDNATQQRLIDKYRIIHNDIHSGNIIRRRNGSFVLLDFGLAIEGSDVVRSSRRRNGAPEFKAPEKWDNEGLLAPQTDIYSFGIVLFEYLAGRVPFPFDKSLPNSSEAEYLLSKAHKEQNPPTIYELRKTAFEAANPGVEYKKDYPDWLETLIMKCLEKDPSNRFANAKELYEFAIENINNPQQSKPVAVPVPIIEEPLGVDDETPSQPVSVESVNSKKEPSVESGPLEGAPEADSSQFEPIPVPTNTKKSSNKWILGFILLAIIAIGGYFLYPSSRDEYNRGPKVQPVAAVEEGKTNEINRHAYVDLGLSVKWATCNVGANAPEEYGDYFAWGETQPKDFYDWSTYKWCNGSYNNLTKYCKDSDYGTVDNKTVLDLADDAANANWGGNWRMPTKEEQQELLDNCTWTWTVQNGVRGFTVRSKTNANSIFLPAAGNRKESGLYDAGSYGGYWSCSRFTPSSHSANFFFFDLYSDGGNWNFYHRFLGLSVRPVLPEDSNNKSANLQNNITPVSTSEDEQRLAEEKKTEAEEAERQEELNRQGLVDLGLPSGTLWKDTNEGGDYDLYTYDEAVEKFGNNLPTKAQLEELENKCTWTWTGSGYKVVGPNGNSIYLPAAGIRECNGDMDGVGSTGRYWSSTPKGSSIAYDLCFFGDRVHNMCSYLRCGGLSVRLVQN